MIKILVVRNQDKYLDVFVEKLKIYDQEFEWKECPYTDLYHLYQVVQDYPPDLVALAWEPNCRKIIRFLRKKIQTKYTPFLLLTDATTVKQALHEITRYKAVNVISVPMETFDTLARIHTTLQMAQSYRSLDQQKIALRDLHHEQSYLMSIVAHDLKAPLNKVLGLNELMPMVGSLNEEQQTYVEMIRKVVEGGRKLIDDILTINAYETHVVPVHFELIQLNDFIRELIDSYQQQGSQKNIYIQAQLEGNISFHSDRESLSRILDNLLSNALKFSPSGALVMIKASQQGKHVYISVKDEGPGISREDQKKMFKKFQKLSAKPTGGENSTGLGLSIIKALVEKLEGKISFESELSKGTTFYVILPDAKAVAGNSR